MQDGDYLPSPHTQQLAIMIVGNKPPTIPQPHIAPSYSGEIGLSWCKGSNRFEVMLDEDDQLDWCTKIDGEFIAGKTLRVTDAKSVGPLYKAVLWFFREDVK